MLGRIKRLATLALVFTVFLSTSMNYVSAISDDEFDKEFTYDMKGGYVSKVYYNKSTSDFYIKATKYKHGGNSFRYDTWLYYVDETGKTKEMDRLWYCKSESSRYGYSINNKSCDVDEYSDKYFFLDNKYTEIDTETGMTKVDLSDFKDKYNADISNIELLVGETQKLSEKIIFNEEDKLTITWESSDNNVATVSNDGTVKAIGNGSCTISAKTDGLKYNIAEYSISVNSTEDLYFNYIKELQNYNENEKYKYIGYKILDLDGDGVKELVVKDWEEVSESVYTNYLYVYNVENGTVVERAKLLLNESLSNRVDYDPYMYLAMRSDGSIYIWSGCGIIDNNDNWRFYVRTYLYKNGEFEKESDMECKSGEVEKNIRNFMEESLPFLNINSQKDDYLFYDSDVRLLNDNELKSLNADELEYARNEIYARYGYEFKSSKLSEEFKSKRWYDAHMDISIVPAYGYKKLNIIEDKNVKKILAYEK